MQLIPERQQEAVADQQAQPPEDGQPQADVVEVVVAAGQQIPGLQLLGGEPLGHLVVHDALHSAPREIEDVGHLELRGRVQVSVAAAPPDLLDLLLQRGGLLGNDSWGSQERQGVRDSSPPQTNKRGKNRVTAARLTIGVGFVQVVILLFRSSLYPECGPLQKTQQRYSCYFIKH